MPTDRDKFRRLYIKLGHYPCQSEKGGSCCSRTPRPVKIFRLTYYVIHCIVFCMVENATQLPLSENLSLELRRGALVLAVLSQLHQEQYGYSLKKSLTDKGLEIDEGTLYPLLRRLESQGLLRSRWQLQDSRPRRYYLISPLGEQVERELAVHWKSLARVLDSLLA